VSTGQSQAPCAAQPCIVYPAPPLLRPTQHPLYKQRSATASFSPNATAISTKRNPAFNNREKKFKRHHHQAKGRAIQLVTAMASPSVLTPASPIQLGLGAFNLASPSTRPRPPRTVAAGYQEQEAASAHDDGEKNAAVATTSVPPRHVDVAGVPSGRLLTARRRAPPPGRPGPPRQGSGGHHN
jgi:hypothetical protein